MRKTLFLFLVLSLVPSLWAQNKFALVIGNSDYKGISKLNNPVNDAKDMAATLQNLGFIVDKVLDGDLYQILTAVTNLKKKLETSRNSFGFFFYAGHGVQSNGQNYLIPVNAANIQSENHLIQFAVSVELILEELSDAGNVLNIIVLDACRDNPFSWKRSGNRGLSAVSNAPVGSIIMYATGANQTAEDGKGRNGTFTAELLKNLETPGLSVFQIFDNTMADVNKVTGYTQNPELRIMFPGAGEVYLGAHLSPGFAPAPESVPNSAPVPARSPAPPGFVRITGGSFIMGSPANEAGRSDDEIQHQVTLSSYYMGNYPVTQKEYEEMMGTNPSFFKGPNLPVEQISWYDAIEYCNRRSQKENLSPAYTIGGSGNNRTVTWNRSADGYRLPTEAEWEYACRAGTTTRYNTGDYISNETGWYDNNSVNRINPVGQKPPNLWGLYDMHGNVHEWCWDWYGIYGTSADPDPQGRSSGTRRVVRGGSWSDNEHCLRSAFRSYGTPSVKYSIIGFRLVRNAQ